MNGDPTHDPTDETGEVTAGHRLSSALTIGSRVVVRYRLAEGSEASATDFVGELVARNDDFLVVDTKTERVKLIRADVIAARDVPPPASMPGRAHQRVSADDLELLMAKGWEPVERAGLGRWVLRAAGGFTGRANSVLPVGDPSLPLAKAIDYCEQWYAERDTRALFQLHGRTGFEVGSLPLGAALLERGYEIGGGRADWERVLVLTALSSSVPPLTTESVPVTADATLSIDWLTAYGQQRPLVPGATEAVLTGSDGQLFLSVRDEATGRIVGMARMAIHPGWAGIFAVWVHPDHRRRGIARAMTSAIAMVARENNMPAIYLQVSSDNAEAIAMYESMGFGPHHEYTYLAQPADDARDTSHDTNHDTNHDTDHDTNPA